MSVSRVGFTTQIKAMKQVLIKKKKKKWNVNKLQNLKPFHNLLMISITLTRNQLARYQQYLNNPI